MSHYTQVTQGKKHVSTAIFEDAHRLILILHEGNLTPLDTKQAACLLVYVKGTKPSATLHNMHHLNLS